jgi:DNA-binding response OmpR family regulator
MDDSSAKIVIVEDDATIARFVELELTHLGHEVTKVADGDLAVAAIERAQPDLVLLDLMLPGTDGITIARQLRAAGHTFPILMLTARSETQDVVAGFDAGADDYLRKPFEVPELLSRVAALLRRVDHGPSSSQYRAANVELDPTSRGVLVDGQPVNFTAKEYDLLEYFVLNAGRVVTRDEILEKVWGGQHATDSNVIEVFVCHLRTKIGDKDNQIIRTIRGVGYFFARS